MPQNKRNQNLGGFDTALNAHIDPSAYGIEAVLHPKISDQAEGPTLSAQHFGFYEAPKKYRVQIKIGGKMVPTDFDHLPNHKEIEARAVQLQNKGQLAPVHDELRRRSGTLENAMASLDSQMQNGWAPGQREAVRKYLTDRGTKYGQEAVPTINNTLLNATKQLLQSNSMRPILVANKQNDSVRGQRASIQREARLHPAPPRNGNKGHGPRQPIASPPSSQGMIQRLGDQARDYVEQMLGINSHPLIQLNPPRFPPSSQPPRRPLQAQDVDNSQNGFEPAGSQYDRLANASYAHPETASARVPYLMANDHVKSQIPSAYFQQDGGLVTNQRIAPDPNMSPQQRLKRHQDVHREEDAIHELQARIEERKRRHLHYQDLLNQIAEHRNQLAIHYGNLGMQPNGHFLHQGDELWNVIKSRSDAAQHRADELVRSGRRKESDFEVRMLRFNAAAGHARLTGAPMPQMPYQITDDMRKEYANHLREEQANSYGVFGGSPAANWWADRHPDNKRQHPATDEEVWDWEVKRHPGLIARAKERPSQSIQRFGRELHEHYEKPIQDWAARTTDDLGVQYAGEDPDWFYGDPHEREAQANAISHMMSLTPYGAAMAPFDALAAGGNTAENGPRKAIAQYLHRIGDDLSGPFQKGLSGSQRFNKILTAATTVFDIYDKVHGAVSAAQELKLQREIAHKYNLSWEDAGHALEAGQTYHQHVQSREAHDSRNSFRPVGVGEELGMRKPNYAGTADRFGRRMQQTGQRLPIRTPDQHLSNARKMISAAGTLKPEERKKGKK